MLKRSHCCHYKDELGNGVLRGGIGNRAPERGVGCPHFPFFPSFTRKDTGGEIKKARVRCTTGENFARIGQARRY